MKRAQIKPALFSIEASTSGEDISTYSVSNTKSRRSGETTTCARYSKAERQDQPNRALQSARGPGAGNERAQLSSQ